MAIKSSPTITTLKPIKTPTESYEKEKKKRGRTPTYQELKALPDTEVVSKRPTVESSTPLEISTPSPQEYSMTRALQKGNAGDIVRSARGLSEAGYDYNIKLSSSAFDRKRVMSKAERDSYKNTFVNERGQGFSQNPDTVVKSVGRSSFGLTPIEYFSGRKESVSTGSTNVYGKDFSSDYIMFKPPKSKVSSFFGKVGSTYKEVESNVSNALTSNFVVPITNFYLDKQSKYVEPKNTLIDVKVPGGKAYSSFWRGVGKEVVDKPITTYGSLVIGRGVGKAFKFAPVSVQKVLSSTKGKVLGFSLLGAYGVGVAKNVFSSDKPFETLGRESVRFSAFSLGVSSVKPKLSSKVLLSKSNKPVDRIEYFKSVSKSKDFGGNILENYRNKPTVFSGGQKTSLGGLFKSNGKTYKVLGVEKSVVKNIGEGKVSRSTTVLNVQRYSSFVGKKFNIGKPRKVYFSSTQVSVPQDEDIFIKSISKIRSKGSPIITRLSAARGNVEGTTTRVKGVSLDTFRGKKISSSENLFKGKFEDVVSRESEGVSYSVSKGQLFGRSVKKVSDLELDVAKNIKSFNRKEFISGANTLVSSSNVKAKSISLISESDLKSAVGSISSQQSLRSNIVSSRLGVSSISPRLEQPKSISISKSSIVIKSFKPLSSPKSVSKQSISIKSSLFPRQDSFIKSVPKSESRSRVSNKLDIGLRQSLLSSSMLRQKNVLRQATKQQVSLKQSTLFKPRVRGFGFIVPVIPVPFVPRERKWSFGKLLEGSSKGKSKSNRESFYVSSIEANLFNIKSKKSNIDFNIAKTGLGLRPIIAGGNR